MHWKKLHFSLVVVAYRLQSLLTEAKGVNNVCPSRILPDSALYQRTDITLPCASPGASELNEQWSGPLQVDLIDRVVFV